MKIVIIADGNNQLGMGHIYQSLSLAELLKIKTGSQVDIFFYTKSEEYVCDLIRRRGFEVLKFTSDELLFDALKQKAPNRIIFDKLDVNPELAKQIKQQLTAKLIICTNLTSANDFADMTVLADIGSDFKNIRNQDKLSGKIEFFGPKFWLLRPEFYTYHSMNKVVSQSVESILLIFGGADPCNFSSKVVEQLLKIPHNYKITLVLGSAFGHKDFLNNLIKNYPTSKSELHIIENADNIAELMYNSDLVFASPGLSFFEALIIGTPVICFHQNDLQKEVYAGYFNTFGEEDINKISGMLLDRTFNFSTDPSIKNMEIGLGKDEIINEILK